MKRFQVIAIDVWGNETDGYVVNNAFKTGKIIEVVGDDDSSVINALIEIEYLTDKANTDTVTVTGEDDFMLSVDATDTGEPLWQLIPELTD